MRSEVERLVDTIFPGMGWRPLYLTASATWLLVLYHHHGAGHEAPVWFIESSTGLFQIEDLEFHQHLWSHCTALVLLMAIPLMLCWYGEGWTPRDLGIRVKGSGPEFIAVILMWLVMVPVVWFFHDQPAFAAVYPRLEAARTSSQLFFLFESLYLLKWIGWEFFFRGFMLFGFSRDFLRRSILISTIPFTLMHYGKPEAEMASAMIAGLILCYISLRSRSIWPGVLLHWLVASTMDFMACEWWR